jgi:hypothetical protein
MSSSVRLGKSRSISCIARLSAAIGAGNCGGDCSAFAADRGESGGFIGTVGQSDQRKTPEIVEFVVSQGRNRTHDTRIFSPSTGMAKPTETKEKSGNGHARCSAFAAVKSASGRHNPAKNASARVSGTPRQVSRNGLLANRSGV